MSMWSATDVERHLPALRRYARAVTRDATQADDLVQQALLRGYERAGTFKLGAPLLPWLLAILHNQFVSDRRRAQVERSALDQIGDQSLAIDPSQPLTVELGEVRARFDALSDSQRSILHLIVVEGLSYQDAAAALSVPVGTVMSRLSRARAALRGDAIAETRPALRIVGGRDAE